MVEALPASRPALLFRQATRVERPALEGAIGSGPAHSRLVDPDKPRGHSPSRACAAQVTGNVSVSDSPLTTTVIPTYRRPEMLRRADWSVLNQDFERLQICIYDNASGDSTRKVAEAFAQRDRRIKYPCHRENIWPAANFDFGLSNVATPYFSVLSDDDMLLPGFYSAAAAALEARPGSGLRLRPHGHARHSERWGVGPARRLG